MARLIVSLCLAAYLMVALPAIVLANNPLSCITGRSSGGSKKVEEIKAIRESANKEGSPERWETLAKACAEMLVNEKLLKKLSSEEVKSIVDDLKHSLGQLPNMKAKDLGLTELWTDLLPLRAPTLECRDLLSPTKTVKLANRIGGNRQQFEYVLDCFRDYLIKCGYEDKYKTVITAIEEKSDSKYEPTLDSFLRGTFWKRNKEMDWDELNSILSSVLDLHGIETGYFEKICESQRHKDTLSDLIERGFLYGGQLLELTKDYFAIYLKDCGYEDRFKEVMKKQGIAIDRGDSPFFSHLFSGSLLQYEFSLPYQIIEALGIVDELSGEFKCDVHKTYDIYDKLNHSRREKFTKFLKCLRGSFADYLKGCASEFKAKMKALEGDKALSFIKDFGKQVETEFRDELSNSQWPSREILGGILDERLSSDRDGKTSYFRTQCSLLRGFIEPFIDALTYDYNLAAADDEIMKIMDVIGYCFYKGVNFWLGSARIINMFNKLGAPYIPSKAQPKRPERKFPIEWQE